ncbi:Asp-tRNA(Asn)/Glu-tRNA(Gln) amidotransferase A subunit family amidase [Microbacterium endophyticum]|uniref:Asp-tRNA(Asn)/Glu-tRNA(Gln) amidotransferase A subunit family amidase n=1 Tax=Microbacterium endophyticum TaxID=1526412 RepID=A0A7W4V6H9_9MICO|nr:AtzH-like domain-containing protein [Microbacterium endophyticum]MBB2977120.1 Asp-tRNA(Asn)/Glu-tRNA(Gln) amidotransferase A subunit family amidase [Microbacterium endophyticum]NIK36048.1 Asp-tRNA(Asn)/Glu-tRNA(Gln) amidotransferase A subunit family amidase [Microbacterium endophyticum]
MTPAVPTPAEVPTGMPDDLFEALTAYERAIIANDLDALDAFFAPGSETMRGDAGGLLVGHDVISAFRGVRGGVPPRTITHVEHRELAPDVALVVSVSRYHGGGTGLQTQVWQRTNDVWRISAAHVTPRAHALDKSVWRTVGDPLWQGAWDGPLEGLTVAVKDLFAIKGYRIGAGNPTFLDSARPESTTAAAVSDLLRGGASLRGIARTDEFAYSIAGDNAHYGTPPNGALPGALPGGSSSGPATAVATGQAEIALATDTAGSIRVPASYQGLWGLRTTHGLVPRQGLLPLAQSFDTVGWLTRDGETLQKVVDWCLSYDGSDSTERVFGESGDDLPWRFLVPDEALAAVEDDTRAAFDAFLAGLAASDDAPMMRRVSIGDLDDYYEPFRTVQASEAWRNNSDWLRAHPGATGAAVAERFRLASEVTSDAEARARTKLQALGEQADDMLRGAVMMMPTVPGPAPMRTSDGAKVDVVRQATLRMTTPAAVGGFPAISIPLLTVPSKLGPAPVGICLVSRSGTDIALVRLARRLAGAARAFHRTETP